MTVKRVLILYTSKGLGHKIIAENIGWHLQQSGYQVKFGDLLQIQNGNLVKYFSAFHTFINEHMAWLWKFFYTNKIFINLTLPLRLKFAPKHSAKAEQFINEYNPDVVLVTQASFAGLIAYLKQVGAYTKPLAVAFSDYHLHRYWLYEEIDFYLANIPEQKEEMIKLGIPANKIAVCGITLKPLVKADPIEVRSKIALLSSERLVILAAGSMGIGLNLKMIQEFSDTLQLQSRKRGMKVVLAVICGNNKKLYSQLMALKLHNVKVYGYYMPLSELYQVADVFLSKPGGLSVAEALSYRLPILFTHFLPGQEELNLDYLIARDVVMGYEPIARVDKVAWRVLEEIQTGEFRKKLAQNPFINELSPTDGKWLIEQFDSQVAKY